MLGAIIGDIAGSKNMSSTIRLIMISRCSARDATSPMIPLYGGDSWCDIERTKLSGKPVGLVPPLSFSKRSVWRKIRRGGFCSLDPQPYNSFGNGSGNASIASGLAIRWPVAGFGRGRETALPTHNHPEGIKGAKAVAHAIWHFRKSRFSEESKECKDKNSKESDDKAMKAFKDIARSYYEDFDTRDYPKGKFDETCMDAVPLSFYLLASLILRRCHPPSHISWRR